MTDYCRSSVTRHHVRPCSIIVDDPPPRQCCSGYFKARMVIAEPVCCFLDTRPLLAVLAFFALLYSIGALICTAVYAPNILFLSILSFSILTNLIILAALLFKKTTMTKVSLFLAAILVFLLMIGTVYCIFYVVFNFQLLDGWRWKFYLISMAVFQVCTVFYAIAMTYLISEIIVHDRRVENENCTTRTIPVQRKY